MTKYNTEYHAPTSEETAKSGSLGKASAWAIRRYVQQITTDAIINAYATIQAQTKEKPLTQIKSEIALQIFAEIQKWVLDVPIKARREYPPLSDEEKTRRKLEAEKGRKSLAEKRLKEKLKNNQE
jgi:hypothetical protein